jgi:hypothetical protein
MSVLTISLLFLSILVAGSAVFFQYFHKSNPTKVQKILALLRFLGILSILILLINPKIKSENYQIEKTPLVLVVDNSESVNDLKANRIALNIHKELSENAELLKKYDIQSYQFDTEIQSFEKLNFKGKLTNIEKVAKNLKSIYKNRNYPAVLISDGNQTSGDDYVFSFDKKNKVYPLILGDTTTFLDIKVNQLNSNKYTFLKNKFPVEAFINYSGTKNINTTFTISNGGKVVHSQNISLSPNNKSVVINALLPAEKVGLQLYKANIKAVESEKNTKNNYKNFAVEVIDQRSEVGIISTINHPDIGAIKRAIESNSLRKVSILKPSQLENTRNYNVLILYQPSNEFRTVFEQLTLSKVNTWIITGVNTDYSFLNSQLSDFEYRMSSQNEDYIADYNPSFNLFAIDDIGFETFPPLQNKFGSIVSKSNLNTLLSVKIKSIETNQPLLTFTENSGTRTAYLFGENIWKWRLKSHVENKSYEKFDVFIDKIIQFLATANSKKSLVVNHESFYNAGELIEITAQYFNKNYEFDDKARLTATITNKETKEVKKYDLLKTNNAFKVNFEGLSPGKYFFSVKELNSNTIYNNFFEIIDFDIERQFVNPDTEKLKQLASQTSGVAFMPNQLDTLVKKLLNDDQYKDLQKKIVQKIPLISWKWLLSLIVTFFALEWFLRKYNGML